MVIEQFNQESLLKAITSGRSNFTGVTLTSDVDITLNPTVGSLIFDKAHLGPSFKIGGWQNDTADLSMLMTTGQEVLLDFIRIRSVGLCLRGDSCWLRLKGCGIKHISLTGSVFNNGLLISESWADVLDVSKVESAKSIIENEDWFRTIIIDGAKLGKRESTPLGELKPHAA